MAPPLSQRSFAAYNEDFRAVLDLVLRRRKDIGPQTGERLYDVIENRAAVEFRDRGDIDLADVFEIVKGVVETQIRADTRPRKVGSGLTSLPGKAARDQIRATLSKQSSISRKELAKAESESDCRIVKLCSEFLITEEQLLLGLKHLDHVVALKWRPPGSSKRRLKYAWVVEKAVFRYYLAGISLNRIADRIRHEFAELGAKVEIPDTQAAVADVAMSIRAIPTLVILSLLVFAMACGTAVAKALGLSSATAVSWSQLGTAILLSAAVLSTVAALALAAGALLLYLFGRSCQPEQDDQLVISPNHVIGSTMFGLPQLELVPPDFRANSTKPNRPEVTIPTQEPDTQNLGQADVQEPAGIEACLHGNLPHCGTGAGTDRSWLLRCDAGLDHFIEDCGSRTCVHSLSRREDWCGLPTKPSWRRCGASVGFPGDTICLCTASETDCEVQFHCEGQCSEAVGLPPHCPTLPRTCPHGNGLYCGDEIGMYPEDLYACKDNNFEHMRQCEGKCRHEIDGFFVECNAQVLPAARTNTD